MRSKTGYAEFGYFHCCLKMDAPRALVFRPLVKGNEALGTRLLIDKTAILDPRPFTFLTARHQSCAKEKSSGVENAKPRGSKIRACSHSDLGEFLF